MNPKVNFYFSKESKWQQEIGQLRSIALDCGLTEVLKWGCPCYTWEDRNIVLIHTFKDYCAYLLFKGVLLADPEGILVQQTENVQTARQIRFTSLQEIKKLQGILKSYINEAIEVERSGLKPISQEKPALQFPEEFQKRLAQDPELKAAFEALTPGRQRAYNLFFTAPKQSKTRESRIEKCLPQILSGKGLND